MSFEGYRTAYMQSRLRLHLTREICIVNSEEAHLAEIYHCGRVSAGDGLRCDRSMRRRPVEEGLGVCASRHL